MGNREPGTAEVLAAWLFASAALSSCGGPGPKVDHPTLETPHPPHARGELGVYVARPRIDPFPDAPEADGWGSRSVDDHLTHLALVSARPEETSADAVARRGMPPAQLPADARLLYEVGKPYPHIDEWAFSSVVVSATPTLTMADVTCTVVERPFLVINITSGRTQDGTWPYVALTWSPAIHTRLDELVASDPDVALYAAFGDDVVDDWQPGRVKNGTAGAELQIPAPSVEAARAVAASLPCPAAH